MSEHSSNDHSNNSHSPTHDIFDVSGNIVTPTKKKNETKCSYDLYIL